MRPSCESLGRPTALCLLLLLVSAAAIAPAATAQEASVAPGVNDRFLDPEVDAEVFVGMFESESREIYRHRADLVAALDLRRGMAVADVGAGTGLFSREFARAVGSEGRVYAVDISEKLLAHIDQISHEEKIGNIETVLGGERSIHLAPESVDLVFICDTYHHFEYPVDVLASVYQALRPGGQLVVVDFERVRGVSADWVVGHVRAGKGTVSDEIKDAGFSFEREIPLMEEQYVIAFRKRS